MDEADTRELLIAGAVGLALLLLYWILKPAPPPAASNDVSWGQAGQAIVLIAEYY